ncbi:hypothetical protein [Adhaeribacter pallidiroseus]|uniref:hypothetical protein n=1 Tax=Adhaeribacter pallidiroseus TaxID=2072847 RepID=UPI0011C05063|nr:hypothetical protein [Adhaeribacter pallidiroseus]
MQRIFNLNIILNARMRQLDVSLLKPEVKNRVLLIALPDAPDIIEIIKSKSANPADVKIIEYDFAEEDFAAKPYNMQSVSEKESIVILAKNFDYDPFSEASLKLKIAFLQKLNALEKVKIVLQLSRHPDCWEDKLKEEERKEAQELPDLTYVLLLQQFLDNLILYNKIFEPLQGFKEISFFNDRYVADNKEYLIRVIEEECNAVNHLKQFKEPMKNYVISHCQSKNINREDIILRLKSLAQLYYRGIWSACTEEEHYFLYDMAQDGLVNTKNLSVLSSLLGKGLLLAEDTVKLKIMNDSFRSFVLTEVNPEEALRYERKNSRGSKWELYRTPLILILLGVASFIFFTQKESWANIITIITAVSTILTILPRLGFLVPAFLIPKESK